VHRLEIAIFGIDAILQKLIPMIGRAVLVEVEYARAIKRAELEWVRSVSEDIRTGRLTWGEGRASACPPRAGGDNRAEGESSQ